MLPSHKILRTYCLLAAAVLLISAQLSFGEESTKKPEISEQAKKRIAREKRFIYRALDELEKSLRYARENIDGLEKQIDAISLNDLPTRKKDLREMMNWDNNYADWLKRNAADFESDLNLYDSGETRVNTWVSRYDDMVKGYKLLEKQLKEKIKQFEEDKRKLENSIRDRNLAIDRLNVKIKDKTDETNKVKLLIRDKANEEKEAKRIETDILIYQNEVHRYENEIGILTELLKRLEEGFLIEKIRSELDWFFIKISDYSVLNEVAAQIGHPDPSILERAYQQVINAYQADIFHLQKRFDEVDKKLSDISPYGTYSDLDRSKELSEYYRNLKSRYYNHIKWLKTQIGSYEADITEIRMMKH